LAFRKASKVIQDNAMLQLLQGYIQPKPKRIFLIDGIGAFLTVICLLAILTVVNPYFGMPDKWVRIFLFIAMTYFIFSLGCFALLGHHWKPYLKMIILGNIGYCILTLSLMGCYYPILTIFDFGFFLLEVLVLIYLASVEYKLLFL
jgi:hypothetical protein